MTRSRSIAVAQTCPLAGDVQANLDEHIRLARLAAIEGAEVVAFPELSLTGYELALAPRLAFSEADPRLSSLLDVAVSQGMILVVGAPVRVGSILHIEPIRCTAPHDDGPCQFRQSVRGAPISGPKCDLV